MKLRTIVTLALAAISFLLIACKPDSITPPAGPTSTPARDGGGTDVKQGPEADWDNTLVSAKKEGKVVVYATLLAPMMREVSPMFKSRYGLIIDVTTGRGAEVRSKLLAEQKSGLFLADVAISGLNTIFTIKEAGASQPVEPVLVLPEVIDRKAYYEGELPFADKDRRIFRTMAYAVQSYIINSDMIKPDELKSYHDLLNPKFKGKMIMSDPTITGSGFNLFSTLIFRKVLDVDFFRQLVKQEPAITRDLRLQVEWLARGKYGIAWGAENAPVRQFKDEGVPIVHIIAKEGTYLSASAGNLILVNRTPHPYAAKVFINWLLSKEGQIMQQKFMGSQSSRVDIPLDGVESTQIRKAGDKYFIGASETEGWVETEQDRYLEMAREIFGPLVR